MSTERSVQRLFLLLLLCHAVFVIYGSLAPFRFAPVALGQAWAEFQQIILSPPRLFSRANLLANILIGIPGPFLFLAAFQTRNSRLAALALLVPAVVYSTVLAGTAEFLQLFFPARITTLSDILAQTLGGAMGAVLWLVIGPFTRTMLGALLFQDDRVRTEAFLFWCYLGLLLIGHSLPLDMTAKLGSLYRQWEEGRILLVPFQSWTGPLDLLQSLPTVLIWVPVGWYLARFRSWPLIPVVLAIIALAASLEFMQIFVRSRTTDATASILALAGGSVGWRLGKEHGNALTAGPKTQGIALRRHILLGGTLFLGWFTLVLLRFWSPFTFQFDKTFLAGRVRDMGMVPLQMYVGKNYLHSAVNILELLAYFLPLGLLFSALVSRHFQGHARRAVYVLFGIMACLLAGLIEFGQIFIPPRYPDITDWLLMVAGALIGHALGSAIWKKRTIASLGFPRNNA